MLELGPDLTKTHMFTRTLPAVVEDSLANLIAESADEFEATLLDHDAELRRIDDSVMPNGRDDYRSEEASRNDCY